MRNSILTAAFCCCLALPSLAQQSSRLLEWKKGALLEWGNFKGKADPADMVHAAVTYAGIEVKIDNVEFLSGHTTFIAKGVFDQHQSWAHPERRDSRVLSHEQIHFDIAEVYARKLQQKLNSQKIRKQDREKVKKLQQLYTQAQLATQSRFDEESLHGLNTSVEQAWRRQIDQELRFTTSSLQIMPQTFTSKK